MKNFYYFIYFLGILSLFLYFPNLFFAFVSKNGVDLINYIPHNLRNFYAFFIMLFPLFLGFFLVILAKLKLKKANISEINQLLENSVRIENMNLEEIRNLDYSKDVKNSQKSKEIHQEIVQILERKNPFIKNLIFVSYQISDKLRTFNFLKKLQIENCRRENLYIQDYTAFWYKSQSIEMINFVVKSSGKSPNSYEYLCIRFENLEKNEKVSNLGQIAIEKDYNWRFSWNYDLGQKNQKIKDENSEFYKIFQVSCTNENEAKNYLTNQKMTKLMKLRQNLSMENTFFYFDNSTQKSDVYVIFGIENNWKWQKNLSVAQNTVNRLNLVCKIWDEFVNF